MFHLVSKGSLRLNPFLMQYYVNHLTQTILRTSIQYKLFIA
jgi:hypothetical protein